MRRQNKKTDTKDTSRNFAPPDPHMYHLKR